MPTTLAMPEVAIESKGSTFSVLNDFDLMFSDLPGNLEELRS